jgi:hypothetical protein
VKIKKGKEKEDDHILQLPRRKKKEGKKKP